MQQQSIELSCARAIRSHCSDPHNVSHHQLPSAIHGPYARSTLYLRPRKKKDAGRESCTVTRTASGGLICRNTESCCGQTAASGSFELVVNGSTENASGS